VGSMDRRGALPQDCAGGGAGWPCRRRRPATVGPPSEHVAAEVHEIPDKQVHFSGTGNMPWTHGRARSAGTIKSDPAAMVGAPGALGVSTSMPSTPAHTSPKFAAGTTLDKVYRVRTESEFDLLVQVLTDAMEPTRRPDLFQFPPPPTSRRSVAEVALPYEKRQRMVLHALRRYPLCDVYDLLQCSDEYWAKLSRELQGLGHGKVKRVALERLQTQTTPLQRAAFWTTIRQSKWEQGRSCNFPGPASGGKKVAQPPSWWTNEFLGRAS